MFQCEFFNETFHCSTLVLFIIPARILICMLTPCGRPPLQGAGKIIEIAFSRTASPRFSVMKVYNRVCRVFLPCFIASFSEQLLSGMDLCKCFIYLITYG